MSLFSLAVFYSLPPASLGPFPISFCSVSLLLLFSCLPLLTFASSPLQLSLLIFFPLSDFMSACPGLRLRQQQQHFLCKYIPVTKHVTWNFCLQRLVSMNPSKGRGLYIAGSGQCLDGSATKSNNVSDNVSLFMPLGNTFLPKSFSV